MARNRWKQVMSQKRAVNVGAIYTALQILAPAGIREAITGISISFDGTSNVAQPVLVECYIMTTAGTMTANNPVKLDQDLGTGLQITGQEHATAEPTKTTRLASWLVHPQSGMPIPLPLPDGEIILAAATRFGLTTTAPAAVNVVAEIQGEE